MEPYCYSHMSKLKKPYSHEIIDPLGQGAGQEYQVPPREECCEDRGYYHLDATFDNTPGHGEMIHCDYVNLEDKQIFRDHESSRPSEKVKY